MDSGEFREDLFFRLNVLPVVIPPLRERQEDIPYLLQHFLRRESILLGIPPKEIAPKALEIIQAYSWPGNVRELENMVKLMLVSSSGNEILRSDLPLGIQHGTNKDQTQSAMQTLETQFLQEEGSWEDMDKRYALYLLTKHHWVISKAAREAGMKRSTFDSRLKKLGIRKNQ